MSSLRTKARRVLESRVVQVKTKSVEEMLLPFIEQVSTLRSWQPSSMRKKGRFRNIQTFIQLVHKATSNFLDVGRKIANQNPSIREEILQACEQIQIAGNVLNHAANGYIAANDSLDHKLTEREKMEEGAKQLLVAVTRLLVLADLLDISKIVCASDRALVQLQVLEQAKTWEDFSTQMHTTRRDIARVTELAALRQKDMKSEAAQQLLVAAQLELNQYSRMLLSATKVFLDNPEVPSAEENREYVIKGMHEILRILAELAEGEELSIIQTQHQSQDHQSQAESPSLSDIQPDKDGTHKSEYMHEAGQLSQPMRMQSNALQSSVDSNGSWYQSQAQAQLLVDTSLATTFQNFETLLDMASRSGLTAETPQQLEQSFQKIIDIGAQLAALESTRNCQGLIAQSDLVKEKLDDLLSVAAAAAPREPRFLSQDPGAVNGGSDDAVDEAIAMVEQEATLLRSELRRAVHDHVSDVLLEPCLPLMSLAESAQHGQMTQTASKNFETQSDKLEQVGQLVCSLATSADSVRPVMMSVTHLHSLRPQVIVAARTLNAMPDSNAAQRNMEVFAEAYAEEVARLMTGVDAIVPLHDIITVTEAHVREDSRHLVDAVEHSNLTQAKYSAQLIRSRCQRLIQAVDDDLGVQPSHYTHHQVGKLAAHLKELSETALPKFNRTLAEVQAKMQGQQQVYEHDVRKLENHLQDVNDSIHGLRKSVLRTLNPSDLGESEFDEMSANTSRSGSCSSMQDDWPLPVVMKSHTQPVHANVLEEEIGMEMFATTINYSPSMLHAVVEVVEEEEEEVSSEEGHRQENESEEGGRNDEEQMAKDVETFPDKRETENQFGSLNRRLIKRTPSMNVIDESETTQALMAQLPAREQAKIAKVQEILQQEAERLETEVSKWDDSSNDIVLLAKEICWMVMDMSDFTRGLGPLKTTMDVINTAKDIARGGEYLNKIARKIADACPDKSCCKDLQAYLDRVKLCCHQLRITSAVKADLNTSVQKTVDGASNLIMASKNLMNSVVLVVKTCYVASNVIARKGGVPMQFLQWRMLTPKKKDLYVTHPLENGSEQIMRGTSVATVPSPITELGEFQGRKRSDYTSESGGSSNGDYL